MSQAKRRRERLSRVSEAFGEMLYENISLHWLPPAPEIDGAYMAKLTDDESLGDFSQVVLQAYRAEIGGRMFHVGFALGDGESFSAGGSAVIARLGLETQNGQLHVVPGSHKDVTWDIVLRHLRSFGGQTLLFVFPDPDTNNAGVAEMLNAYTDCLFTPMPEMEWFPHLRGHPHMSLTVVARMNLRKQIVAEICRFDELSLSRCCQPASLNFASFGSLGRSQGGGN